jgi:PAS domain S-box-containing protein
MNNKNRKAKSSSGPGVAAGGQTDLAVVFERIADGIVSLDNNWRFTYVNKKAGEFIGRRPEELIGKNIWTEFAEGKDRPVYEAYQRAMEDQRPIHFEEYSPTWDRWFEYRAYPSPAGLTVFFQDVTEHKRANLILQESEVSYRELADSIKDIFFALDHDLKCSYWNSAAEKKSRLSREEALGKSLFEIFPPAKGTKVEETCRQVLKTQHPQTTDFYLKGKDRDYVFELTAYPSKQGISVFARDITEKAKLERELAAQAADLRNLSSRLLHAQEEERKEISRELHDEMGQALTMVSLNFSYIKKTLGTTQKSKVKNKIDESDGLIRKLLEQVHEMTLDLHPHMLDDLGLLPTVKWFAERFSKNLNLAVRLTENNWSEPVETGLALSLFRIIQEALTNAAKHARAKKIRIHLSQDRNNIEALIEDDGCGFDPAQVEQERRKKHGVGFLGMKERAAYLNGKCLMESRPGRGTRIHIILPKR